MRIGDNEGIDSLGEALASRLGEVAEPKAIDQLRQSSPPGISGAFGRCLQRAGCRPYLLARLSDGREPLALREQWSQILADSSWTYVREVAGRIGDAPREADLCQRMSAIATRNLGTTFSRTLITALGKTAEYGSAEHPLPPAIASDLQAAATELVLAYPRAQVLDRYRIAEALMLIGGDEYAKVHPSGGPLLTLVEPDTVSRTPAGPRDIRLMAHFRSLLSAQEVPVDLSLVLRHPGTGRETELKTNLSTERWAQSSGSTWLFGVTLPDELPRGKYDVFLRGRKGARLVGDGLGCQLDLPR